MDRFGLIEVFVTSMFVLLTKVILDVLSISKRIIIGSLLAKGVMKERRKTGNVKEATKDD